MKKIIILKFYIIQQFYRLIYYTPASSLKKNKQNKKLELQ